MIPLMVEELSATGTRESPVELTALVRNFVMELNGKQTIYQMIRLSRKFAPGAARRATRWRTRTAITNSSCAGSHAPRRPEHEKVACD